MAEIFYCEQCGEPMELQERLKNGKGRNGSYRRRRFKCTNLACDHTEMIFAGGTRDGHVKRYSLEERLDIEKHDRPE